MNTNVSEKFSKRRSRTLNARYELEQRIRMYAEVDYQAAKRARYNKGYAT